MLGSAIPATFTWFASYATVSRTPSIRMPLTAVAAIIHRNTAPARTCSFFPFVAHIATTPAIGATSAVSACAATPSLNERSVAALP
ncbi:MAG: hypothetical protein H0T66_00010 [Geodermatophilaceae bacterium]|nr:hypothetical protein [Geodermatophilaceae bacterium]